MYRENLPVTNFSAKGLWTVHALQPEFQSGLGFTGGLGLRQELSDRVSLISKGSVRVGLNREESPVFSPVDNTYDRAEFLRSPSVHDTRCSVNTYVLLPVVRYRLDPNDGLPHDLSSQSNAPRSAKIGARTK